MDRRRRAVTLLPVLVALIATACGPAPISGVQSLSPTQVVQDYYQYVARHDARRAAQFLAPQQAKLERSSPDSDLYNIRTLSDVTVTQPYNIRLDGSYQDEVQVVASYRAEFKRVVTAHSGPQTRFLELGRNDPSEPWVIFAIGTGP